MSSYRSAVKLAPINPNLLPSRLWYPLIFKIARDKQLTKDHVAIAGFILYALDREPTEIPRADLTIREIAQATGFPEGRVEWMLEELIELRYFDCSSTLNPDRCILVPVPHHFDPYRPARHGPLLRRHLSVERAAELEKV